MLRDAKPYAQRLFAYYTLGQLSKADARLALVGPAALQNVEFHRAGVDLVVAESGGYPYFLQEYGRVLWDEVDSRPSPLSTCGRWRRSSRTTSTAGSSALRLSSRPTPSSAICSRSRRSATARTGPPRRRARLATEASAGPPQCATT